MDPINFGRLWPETVAAVRRHTDLLWPVAAAFLFMPQLLMARQVNGRTPDQLFRGDDVMGDSIGLILLVCATLFVQLVIARIVADDSTDGDTLGSLMLQSALRLPHALAVLAALFLLLVLLSAVPAAVIAVLGGGSAAGAVVGGVAGLAMSARLGVALPLVATENHDPFAAIGEAWRLTKGRTLRICGMLATLLLGFLLLSVAIGGIGAAVGVVSVAVAGPAAEGWGVGRWLFEMTGAAASAAMGTFQFAFATILMLALKKQPAAAG
jgi:hypothetical protein